jgi:CheY-like chemotaxis protein
MAALSHDRPVVDEGVALWYNDTRIGLRAQGYVLDHATTEDRMAEEKHILIVDDDIELGNLLAKAVGDMSDAYVVRVARNVDEAMVQVRKSQTDRNAFDLVITDIKMSGLSGLELLEALNAIAPGTKTIAMTAYNSSEIADRAKELAVEAYLTKPFIISEFRQIVRDTLSLELLSTPPQPQAEATALSAEQRAAITSSLASLRTMTGATVALFVDSSGEIIAIDTLEPEASMGQLCTALQAAQRTITEQMTKAFDQDCHVKQSYFGTDDYSICTSQVGDGHTAAVMFGQEVKEGQVWYYLRETSTALTDVLDGTLAQPERRRRATKGDVFEMLDGFFPDHPQHSRHRSDGSAAEETAPPETGTQQEMPIAVDAGPADRADAANHEPDAPTQETDETFDELSFEAVLEAGWSSQSTDPLPEAEGQEEIARPPVDDIDWNIATDLDWDKIVEETDKGLDGLSLEEAQEQGLIDEVDESSSG